MAIKNISHRAWLSAVLIGAVIATFYYLSTPSHDSNLIPVLRATMLESGKSIKLPYFEVHHQQSPLVQYSYSMPLDGEIADLLRTKKGAASNAPEYGLLYPQIINGGNFYLNDVWVAGLIPSTQSERWLWYRPLLIPLPSNLLRSDGQPNVIKVVQTTHEAYILAGRPYVGPLTELSVVSEVILLLSSGLAITTNLFSLIIGLFMLGAWVASPKDKVFGLAGSVIIIWALLLTLAVWQYMPMTLHQAWRWIIFVCTGGLIVLMTIFVFAFIEEPLSKLQIRLLVFYAGIAPVVYAIAGPHTEHMLDQLWTPPMLLVYVYACIRLTKYCFKTRSTKAITLLVLSAFCVVLAYHDYGVVTGILTNIFPANLHWQWYLIFVQPIYLSQLGLPLMLFFLSLYQSSVNNAAIAYNNMQIKLREREFELIFSHEQQKRLELIEATRIERDRIYQDVHDGIGSRLVTAVFSIRQGHRDINSIESQLMDCLNDLRMVINSQNDDNNDIQTAVFNYCLLQEARLGGCGLIFNYDVGDGAAIQLAPQIHINVLRILQEAITNAIKHAHASEILVKIDQADAALTLSIIDNGQGLVNDADHSKIWPSGGRGLTGMAARAKSIGGEFTIEKTTVGTTASLRLPLAPGLFLDAANLPQDPDLSYST